MAKNWLYWLDRGGRILPGRIQSCWGKQSYRVRLAAWRMQKSSIKWVNGNMAVMAVVLPPPARGPGTLIPSAQRLVWAAKQPLGNAALGALFA